MKRPLMVLGCTSDAGKSLLVTALCRWFARNGIDVAPFKAQNMSNNARVVAGWSAGGPAATGGEIGVAQWLQAKAAGVEPDVRMNPVLLKPESDTRSQVVVRGVVDRELTETPWRDRHDALWTPMAESFADLQRDHDLIVIEGAGSPAEINLRDQVNNRMVDHVDAAAVLVSDIDRGGSFAHLYGTWALVPEPTRRRLAAFVLNKFRGDADLLEPGPRLLTERTGMRHAGVLPMLEHRLPREEGAHEGRTDTSSLPSGAPTVVLPRFPFGSNLDEFHLVSTVADVRWATSPDEFMRLDPTRDLVILPGTKHVASDLAWMRSLGLDRAIVDAGRAGVRVVGVCGGAMMLGTSITDHSGVDGSPTAVAGGPIRGLGLTGAHTVMADVKTVVTTRLEFADAGTLGHRWSALAHLPVDGYEIRFGHIRDDRSSAVGCGPDGNPVAWSGGSILATTVHGLFEDPSFVDAVVGVRAEPVLERTFDLLADAVDEHLDTHLLRALIEAPRGPIVGVGPRCG